MPVFILKGRGIQCLGCEYVDMCLCDSVVPCICSIKVMYCVRDIFSGHIVARMLKLHNIMPYNKYYSITMGFFDLSFFTSRPLLRTHRHYTLYTLGCRMKANKKPF